MKNEDLYQAFYEVSRKMQECIERILDERKMFDFFMEKLEMMHDPWSKEVIDKEPLIQQEKQKLLEEKRKNIDMHISLLEEEKRQMEMEIKLKKVVELERQLNEKQMALKKVVDSVLQRQKEMAVNLDLEAISEEQA